MLTSSLGHLQLFCAVFIWALLQWQPLSGQASHRSGPRPSPTDSILQVCPRTCLLTRDLPGNLHSWLTLGVVTRPTLHLSCPLLFKSLLLACLVMTLRFQIIISSAFAALLHAAAKLHLSPHSASMLFATKPGNMDLDKNHKKLSKNLTGIKYVTVYAPSPKGTLRKWTSLLLIIWTNILCTILHKNINRRENKNKQ